MHVRSINPFEKQSDLSLWLFSAKVSAGFPSPAESFADRKIDLNDELIKHPAATFFVRVEGDSMQGAGIMSEDILIVDRSLTAKDGSIVVAILNGEFTVKRLKKTKSHYELVAENKKYAPIAITAEMDFSVWGVVIHAIHSF